MEENGDWGCEIGGVGVGMVQYLNLFDEEQQWRGFVI